MTFIDVDGHEYTLKPERASDVSGPCVLVGLLMGILSIVGLVA